MAHGQVLAASVPVDFFATALVEGEQGLVVGGSAQGGGEGEQGVDAFVVGASARGGEGEQGVDALVVGGSARGGEGERCVDALVVGGSAQGGEGEQGEHC